MPLLLVLLLASGPAPKKTYFEPPAVRLATPAPPPECSKASARTAALLAEIEPAIPARFKAAFGAIAADLRPGEAPAEGWDRAATLASLSGDPATALWAELHALDLEWRPVFVTHAGVFLEELAGYGDDARLFLECAWDSGYRSPYLLEALANLYWMRGDKIHAKERIDEAAATMIGDPFLDTEKSLTDTGSPPAPAESPADPLDKAFLELQRHERRVVAAIRAEETLKQRLYEMRGMGQATKLEDRMAIVQRGFDAFIGPIPSAIQRAKSSPAPQRAALRNVAFDAMISAYFSLSTELLGQTGSAGQDSIGWDVDFWGEVLGIDPLQLGHLSVALSQYRFQGSPANVPGSRIEDLAGAEFQAMYARAGEMHVDASAQCGRQNDSPAAEKDCEEIDDEIYCATVRGLFSDWVQRSEGFYKRAAHRFDHVAAMRMAAGSRVVEDAWRYGATWAPEMKFATAGGGSAITADLNRRYRDLVDMVAGNLGKPGGRGPFYQARREAESFGIDERNFEAEQASMAQTIANRCAPVDRRMMERIAEQERAAMQETLRDRLLHDFDAKWDSTVYCTVGIGGVVSASIDDTGKVGFTAKLGFEKELPGPEESGGEGEGKKGDNGSVGAAVVEKVKFKDGVFAGGALGVEGEGKYGPFKGVGEVALVGKWNKEEKRWEGVAELSGTLGIGYTFPGNVKVTCFPGKGSVEFEPRVVRADAAAYLQSLDP